MKKAHNGLYLPTDAFFLQMKEDALMVAILLFIFFLGMSFEYALMIR